MKISIIGAGPIGSYSAYLLAQQGHSVDLYEKKPKVGLPLQCTGLVTSSFSQIIKPKKEFLLNTTKKVKIISPSRKEVIIKQKEFVLDRTAFDQYLCNLAHDAGVKIHLNHILIKRETSNLIFKHQKKILKVKPDLIVGADGPLSTVSQIFQFPNQNRFYYGFQARVKGYFQPDTYQVHFGRKTAPNFFSWLVPESSGIARIGLATNQPNSQFFQKLIKRYQNNVIGLQAGLIPIYNPKIKTQFKNVLLIGDAAAQVKATTGGGLIPGLQAAQALAQALENNQPYYKKWKKNLGRNLWLHLWVRKIFNRFNDRDWDKFVEMLGQNKVKNILEKHDREHPFKMLKILPLQPRLLSFSKYLF